MTPTVPPMTESAPDAEADLGQQPHDLLAVAVDRARAPADAAHVEQQLPAEVLERVERPAGGAVDGVQEAHRRHPSFAGTSWK